MGLNAVAHVNSSYAFTVPFRWPLEAQQKQTMILCPVQEREKQIKHSIERSPGHRMVLLWQSKITHQAERTKAGSQALSSQLSACCLK